MGNSVVKRIVVASGNSGKLKEFAKLFAPAGVDVVAQSVLGVPDADETGLTFVENAILKARNACHRTDLISISDDSGLEVDALNGAPGIYSARYAGQPSNDQANRTKLLHELRHVKETHRTARFRCVVVLMIRSDDPAPVICEGLWEGRISFTASGDNGFGYDPVFIPNGFDKSAAELAAPEKNRISHRAQALEKLNRVLETHRLFN